MTEQSKKFFWHKQSCLFRKPSKLIGKRIDIATGYVLSVARAVKGQLGRVLKRSEPVHGLFLYHKTNPATERHFERLVAETKGLVIWHRLYNPGGGGKPLTDLSYEHPSLCMPWRYVEMQKNGGLLQGGLADVAILPSVLASGAPFVWVMEYDVEFAGRWEKFFSQFRNNRADFLTTMLKRRADSEDWVHWPASKRPPDVPSDQCYRSFNPIMRLSRRFALAYVEALKDQNWQGYYECTLPTIAMSGGFSVEEIGGPSEFCPPERRGKNYTAADNTELSGKGSFVWRPVVEGYYPDRPDLFPTKGLLYHPCKNGVSDWRDKEELEEQAQRDIPSPAPRVAVVMGTYNGAEYLNEQLESLARQSLYPDELIVGDDASTDETLSILHEFASTAPFPVRIIERPVRLGFAANFMATADEANCSLILFCDQDDIWHDEKIQIAVNAARATSSLAYSHDLTVFGKRQGKDAVSIPSYFEHLKNLDHLPDLCVKGSALAVKSDFIRKLGWPPQSTISHDAWICLLATALGRRSIINVPLYQHRMHRDNASGWLMGSDNIQDLSKSDTDDAFSSMLDFYLHAWPYEWRDILHERLATAGAKIDPDRAKYAIRALQSWRHGKQPTDLEIAREVELPAIAEALDENYYRSQIPELAATEDVVQHYVDVGYLEGLDPAPYFSTQFYLSMNPDVVATGANPFAHYLLYGKAEGRKGNVNSNLGERKTDEEIRNELYKTAVAEALDLAYYHRQVPEISDDDDLVQHYLDLGWREGLDPTAEFSSDFYVFANPDVFKKDMNPFVHYLFYGKAEGRNTKPNSELELQGFATARTFHDRQHPLTGDVGVVAMVKNEADIIETFISNALALFDLIVVIDHGSTDGTLQYLEDVSAFDPRLTVLQLKEPGYIQAQVMSHVLRSHTPLRDLDWLFFLDADEFLPFVNREAMDECLAKHVADPVVMMDWCNLVPFKYDEERLDLSIVKPFFVPPQGSVFKKVFIQPARVNFDNVCLEQGNHVLASCEPHCLLPAIPADFQLLHLPIRSREQFMKKLNQGVRAIKRANLPSDMGKHWSELHEYLDGREVSDEMLNALIVTYSETIEVGLTYTRDELFEMQFEVKQLEFAQLPLPCKITKRDVEETAIVPPMSLSSSKPSSIKLITDKFGNITVDQA